MGRKFAVGEGDMVLECPEDMAAAMTARMVVSDERMFVVEQASIDLGIEERSWDVIVLLGQPIDVHQSNSSVNMHWSQT
jgi:hypothetical protein